MEAIDNHLRSWRRVEVSYVSPITANAIKPVMNKVCLYLPHTVFEITRFSCKLEMRDIPDIRPDISYPVIIRYPAKQSGIFCRFITETAVKRASTPTAAVPSDKNFTGCTDGVVFHLAVLANRCHCPSAWRRRSIFTTIEFGPAQLNARHLADNMRTHIPCQLVRLVSRRL